MSEQPLYGTIAPITGDDSGLNPILGYVESSANHYCRMCLVDTNSDQIIFSEDDPQLKLRTNLTNEEHYRYLEENPRESSCFGIERNSIHNTLLYFSVIMHDVLEAVAQYEVKLLFEYFNNNFIFTENQLQCVYAFNYGFMDKKNCPTCINLFCTGIGLNASQTLCLIRNIPLIFGEVVTQGDRHWQAFALVFVTHC